MNTAALREFIQQVHLSKACHDHLADLIANRLPRLHRTIQPQGENAEDVLTRFVHAYVEQVPDPLDVTNGVAREAGTKERIKSMLKVAEQFFLIPPALLVGHDGLDTPLDEAYLAHRLVEKMNDRYVTHFGQALIPLDTTATNLVARQLIGEPFANRLDGAVHHAVENMLNTTTFDTGSARAYRENLKNPRVVVAWQQWPYLPKQLGVELSLG